MSTALLLLLVAGLLSASSGIRLRGWLTSWKRDHSRLDRMPVYGKRGTHHSHRLPYGYNGAVAKDKRLALTDRIPASFEKEHNGIDPGFQKSGSISLYPYTVGLHGLQSNPTTVHEHTQPVFGEGLKNETMKGSEKTSEDMQKEKKAPGVLDRMPINFGKRRPSPESADAKNETDEDTSDDKRAKLDRMPLNFGKRSSESSSENMLSGKLHRMPLTFGKRRVSREAGLFEDPRSSGQDKRMAKLDRMPFAYGKRGVLSEGSRARGDIYLEEAHASDSGDLDKRLGKLDRMPFAYGKREDAQDDRHYASYSSEERGLENGDLDKRLGKLDRMPFAYGKREDAPGSTETQDVDGTEGMPVSFDKRHRYRNIGDSSEEKRIVKLDRMPLTYGKRGTFTDSDVSDAFDKGYAQVDSFPLNFEKRPEVETSLDDYSDNTASKRMAKLDRMPITFGKRDDVADLERDRNKDVRQLTEFEPISSRLDRRRAEQMEDIPIQEPSVPHKRFSKLDRMPLRFGKRWIRRLRGGRRTRLAMLHRMPATYGKRFFGEGPYGVPISRKSLDKLNRMPLSYGKRSSDQQWYVPVAHDLTFGTVHATPLKSGEQFMERRIRELKERLEAVLRRLNPSLAKGPGPQGKSVPGAVNSAQPEDIGGWDINALL